MALHKLVLDDMELTALITHLEGQSEMMNESRLNSSDPYTPDREEILLNLVYTKAFTIGWDAHINPKVDFDLHKNEIGYMKINYTHKFTDKQNDIIKLSGLDTRSN